MSETLTASSERVKEKVDAKLQTARKHQERLLKEHENKVRRIEEDRSKKQ